jgi:hypothetical protein
VRLEDGDCWVLRRVEVKATGAVDVGRHGRADAKNAGPRLPLSRARTTLAYANIQQSRVLPRKPPRCRAGFLGYPLASTQSRAWTRIQICESKSGGPRKVCASAMLHVLPACKCGQNRRSRKPLAASLEPGWDFFVRGRPLGSRAASEQFCTDSHRSTGPWFPKKAAGSKWLPKHVGTGEVSCACRRLSSAHHVGLLSTRPHQPRMATVASSFQERAMHGSELPPLAAPPISILAAPVATK